MAFSMSILSWSVIEYSHKYKAMGEYDHVRDIIKWGTDYLLKTFNSTATNIDKVYSQVNDFERVRPFLMHYSCVRYLRIESIQDNKQKVRSNLTQTNPDQVGVGRNGTTVPDDHYCWMRPEDMNYDRPVITSTTAPDLGGEMAAALAAASIVFRDDTAYSKKLITGAAAVYRFARDGGRRTPYSRGVIDIAQYYNSTSYWDEYMWAAAWMYYATGNNSYISFATDPRLPKNAKAYLRVPDFGVLSWDNKLPAAELVWTRLRIFLNPGYPYEESLMLYHNATGLNMCAYLKQFGVFNWTRGKLISTEFGHESTETMHDLFTC